MSNKIARNMKETKKHYPSDRATKLYSNGKKKQDPNMYTGTGGNVYLYYKLIKYAELLGKSSMQETYMKDFLSALSVNLKIVKDNKEKGNKEKSPSFFMSSSGLHLIAALYYQSISEDEDRFESRNMHISYILENYKKCFLKDYSESEVLYGNAGYMY